MNSPVKFWPIWAKKLDVEPDQRVTMVTKVKSNCLPCRNRWLNFRVRGQFEMKILIVRAHKNNIFHINLKKIKLKPATIWKLVTCQRIASKNTRTRWVDTWTRDLVGWYWSADTVFYSCQLITTLMCNMGAILVLLCSQTSWKVWDQTLVSLWCGRTGGLVSGAIRSRDYQIFWDG